MLFSSFSRGIYAKHFLALFNTFIKRLVSLRDSGIKLGGIEVAFKSHLTLVIPVRI